MKVRDLERLLVAHGAGAAKLDAATRRLRFASRLPKSGRGANAPDIGAAQAAMILIALAGSAKGTEADSRLEKLEHIQCRGSKLGPKRLLQALTDFLTEPSSLDDVQLLRVGRTSRHADLVHSDGQMTQFRAKAREPDRFSVEGVLPVGLLKKVAQAIASTGAGRSE